MEQYRTDIDGFVELTDLPVRPIQVRWSIIVAGDETYLIALLRVESDNVACIEGVLPFEDSVVAPPWPLWVQETLPATGLRLPLEEREFGSAEDFVKQPFGKGFVVLFPRGDFHMLMCLKRQPGALS